MLPSMPPIPQPQFRRNHRRHHRRWHGVLPPLPYTPHWTRRARGGRMLAPLLARAAASPPIFSLLDEAVWGPCTVNGHYTPKGERHEVLRYRCKRTTREEGKDLKCTHWRFVSTQDPPWTVTEHGKHTNYSPFVFQHVPIAQLLKRHVSPQAPRVEHHAASEEEEEG